MNALRNFSHRIGILMAIVLILSTSACKSKKKAMEAEAAERARLEQEAAVRKQEEERKQREAEEKARRDAEEAARSTASQPYQRLGQYFESIASSGSLTSANSSISEALTMFASPDTPVLIIISEENGQKDYDRPTTIISYLNYLKDTKKNMNKVEKLQFDSAGKITEVELRKN